MQTFELWGGTSVDLWKWRKSQRQRQRQRQKTKFAAHPLAGAWSGYVNHFFIPVLYFMKKYKEPINIFQTILPAGCAFYSSAQKLGTSSKCFPQWARTSEKWNFKVWSWNDYRHKHFDLISKQTICVWLFVSLFFYCIWCWCQPIMDFPGPRQRWKYQIITHEHRWRKLIKDVFIFYYHRQVI